MRYKLNSNSHWEQIFIFRKEFGDIKVSPLAWRMVGCEGFFLYPHFSCVFFSRKFRRVRCRHIYLPNLASVYVYAKMLMCSNVRERKVISIIKRELGEGKEEWVRFISVSVIESNKRKQNDCRQLKNAITYNVLVTFNTHVCIGDAVHPVYCFIQMVPLNNYSRTNNSYELDAFAIYV